MRSRGAVLIAVIAGAVSFAAATQGEVRDLDGRPLNPFVFDPQTRAAVVVFTTIDCPISNRYAPTINAMHADFAARGITFFLVYANPGDTPEAIREHTARFGYRMQVLRDPAQELVKRAGAMIAPEAVVLDRRGEVVYRGRIDDRYQNLGVDRQVATRHDLRHAIEDVLAGRVVATPRTPAVGCILADFK